MIHAECWLYITHHGHLKWALTHIVQQKLTQNCKASILQLTTTTNKMGTDYYCDQTLHCNFSKMCNSLPNKLSILFIPFFFSFKLSHCFFRLYLHHSSPFSLTIWPYWIYPNSPNRLKSIRSPSLCLCHSWCLENFSTLLLIGLSLFFYTSHWILGICSNPPLYTCVRELITHYTAISTLYVILLDHILLRVGALYVLLLSIQPIELCSIPGFQYLFLQIELH